MLLERTIRLLHRIMTSRFPLQPARIVLIGRIDQKTAGGATECQKTTESVYRRLIRFPTITPDADPLRAVAQITCSRFKRASLNRYPLRRLTVGRLRLGAAHPLLQPAMPREVQ